jgi:hypothetical protein
MWSGKFKAEGKKVPGRKKKINPEASRIKFYPFQLNFSPQAFIPVLDTASHTSEAECKWYWH